MMTSKAVEVGALTFDVKGVVEEVTVDGELDTRGGTINLSDGRYASEIERSGEADRLGEESSSMCSGWMEDAEGIGGLGASSMRDRFFFLSSLPIPTCINSQSLILLSPVISPSLFSFACSSSFLLALSRVDGRDLVFKIDC